MKMLALTTVDGLTHYWADGEWTTDDSWNAALLDDHEADKLAALANEAARLNAAAQGEDPPPPIEAVGAYD